MRTSNGHLVVAADRAHRPLLERAQQLGLHAERHLADLVEEAACRPLRLHEEARARGACASVNAPFACPKSSLSSSVSGTAAQLIATKGPVARGACGVERARDQLLAGAALAGDEHGRVGVARRARCSS